MANILIAEDERDIRELINFTLTFGGHQITMAANGEEAYQMVQKMDPLPDLIMLDVRMPKMTGYEACEAMKKLDGIKDIPVVFLTAKGQDEEVQSGYRVGAVDYVLKPFAPDDLNRRVNEILEKIKSG